MSQVVSPPPETDAPPADVGDLYEVVDGQFVEPPTMGAFENHIASVLLIMLANHVTQRRLGRVNMEMLYRIDPARDLQRRPDLSFVSYERWPRERPVPRTAAWDVVPDLVIEVISPGNLAIETNDRVRDYFRADVRQVWVVYPRSGSVEAYRSPKQVTIFDNDDELDGGDILPGFRLRLSSLFNEQADLPQ
jgi:Uma2 family endonuclease